MKEVKNILCFPGYKIGIRGCCPLENIDRIISHCVLPSFQLYQ